MNNLTQRIISGTIFIAIIVGSILFSPYAYAAVFTLVAVLSVREFHNLTNKKPQIDVNVTVSMVGAAILFISAFLSASHFTKYPLYSVYGIFAAVVLLSELFRKKENPVQNWAYFIMGQIYTVLPFAILSYILYLKDYQPIILLAVFISLWVNDSGAYVSGMLLGKHKLFERISPKKTWEGFIGGGIFALISGYIFSIYIPELTLVQWLIFSEIVVIFGTFGDLLESLLKRTLKVKDSGKVIPGHGGLLDRFDSTLLAAPMVYLFLSLFI